WQNASGFFAKAVTHISKISYAMYLINLGLMVQVLTLHFAPQIAAHGILVYIIYWTVLIIASTFIYRFFEKPVMDLRDRF
ncbi:MAG TPA: hypothetical protein VD905_13285, partial [Flavobacteriales bacterium]|nr:hypothetical protein [Flavobacteriales bacterium]